MIKIYTQEQIDVDIEDIINDFDIWSFPISELDYLLEEHNQESFLLYNNRLYELNEI